VFPQGGILAISLIYRETASQELLAETNQGRVSLIDWCYAEDAFGRLWGCPHHSALSQRERGLNPFSLWEKVRMRGKDSQCFITA